MGGGRLFGSSSLSPSFPPSFPPPFPLPFSPPIHLLSFVTQKRATLSQKRRLEREFACGICKKILCRPYHTPCDHNFCQVCLDKQFAALTDNTGSTAAQVATARHSTTRHSTARDSTTAFGCTERQLIALSVDWSR